jgi:nitrate reductase NapA
MLHASYAAELKLRRGDEVKVQSRRGYIRTRVETRGRYKTPRASCSCSSTRRSSSTR